MCLRVQHVYENNRSAIIQRKLAVNNLAQSIFCKVFAKAKLFHSLCIAIAQSRLIDWCAVTRQMNRSSAEHYRQASSTIYRRYNTGRHFLRIYAMFICHFLHLQCFFVVFIERRAWLFGLRHRRVQLCHRHK